jgi:hypothetical protein
VYVIPHTPHRRARSHLYRRRSSVRARHTSHNSTEDRCVVRGVTVAAHMLALCALMLVRCAIDDDGRHCARTDAQQCDRTDHACTQCITTCVIIACAHSERISTTYNVAACPHIVGNGRVRQRARLTCGACLACVYMCGVCSMRLC